MTDFKVGDWVKIVDVENIDELQEEYSSIKDCIGIVFQIEKVEAEAVTVHAEWTDLFPKECVEKVYILDTPPPQRTKTIPLENIADLANGDLETQAIYLQEIAKNDGLESFKIALAEVIKAEKSVQPVESGDFVNADKLIEYLKPDDGEEYMISQTELEHHINVFADNHGVKLPEIKGGHMAGYGRVNHFEYLPLRAYRDKENYLAETITYPDLGLVFCRHPDDKWEQVEGLPHEQEDLKHLFEVK